MVNIIRKKIIEKKYIEKILMIFLIIQPILDLYFLFDEKIVNLFVFSPSTIIRIFFVGVLGILFLIVLKNKKEIYLYLIYIILITIYAIFHHINALNFTNYYNGYDFGYTLLGELFYIIRMLMPLFLIIVSSHYEFKDKQIEKIVRILILIICGSIIVTNILELSTGSYSKEIIKGNILCWFKSDRCNLNYMDLASKGLFLDPNRLSALLVLLTPLTYYILFRNPGIFNKIIIIINILGMFMLGTKVSTYGTIIILILSIIIYLFFSFIKKELKFKHSICIFLIFLLIFTILMIPYSPAVNRTFVDKTIHNNYNSNNDGQLKENEIKENALTEQIKQEFESQHTDEDTEELDINAILGKMTKKEKDKFLIKFVEDNYLNYNLNYHFVYNSYPYTYDAEFWYKVMNLSIEERTNFRTIERMMLDRVKTINNNKYDDYLGITFSRMGNIFDLERDFLSHYYTLGIIGLLLLISPYIIIVLICIIKILINFKQKFNLKNICYLMGIGITLFASYYTGNVMDGLIVTLILGFCIGQLINESFNLKNQIQEAKK